MNLKETYSKLYGHWLKEINQIELSYLSNQDFKDYKEIVVNIGNINLQEEDTIKSELINSYKENLNYLFEDFSKIREIKIINSALCLKEIDLKNLLEAEKLFYQNLISAVKGFEKVKAMATYNVPEVNKIESPFEKDNIKDTKVIETKSQNIINDLKIESKTKDISYLLVRFVKNAPPLVGIDFINYGPFRKEDIVYLPLENAKILIYEKFAEQIEIS